MAETMHTETTPSRPAKSAKRAAILNAATDLFLTTGFDQTSVDAVAAAANVSKTTVYAHFGDKLSLFEAVVEQASVAVDVNLAKITPTEPLHPEEQLAQVLISLIQETTSDQFLALQRVLIAESVRHPELTSVRGRLGVPYVVEMVAAILSADADRHGYSLTDIQAHAALLVRTAVSDLQIEALRNAEGIPRNSFVEQYVRWITAIFLRGLRSAPIYTGEARPQPPSDYAQPSFAPPAG